MIDLEVKGGDQLFASLRQLPIELQVSELSQALKAGGDVIADAMPEEMPRGHDIGPRKRGHEHAADAISVVVEKNPIGSAAEVYVGPNKRVAWRVRFLEYGATVHAIVARRRKVLASSEEIFGKKAKHPGIRAVAPMRKSLDQAGPDAIETFRQRLSAGIARVAKRLKRK